MSDLLTVNAVRITIDVKELNEGGIGTSGSSPVTINLNKSFAAIYSVIVTPKPTGATRYYTGVIFDETLPNPTSFQVFLLDVNGTAASGIPFSWAVRGTQGA